MIYQKSPKKLSPGYCIVVSNSAKEIAWFFNSIKEISYKTGLIDFFSKYDFFLALGEKINSLDKNIDTENLLFELINFLGKLPDNYFIDIPKNDDDKE